jgi:hypothetical protein
LKSLCKTVITINLVLFGSAFVFAQTKAEPACGIRPKIGVTPADCFKPIVFGKTGDGFPDKLKIKGVITRVTFTHISCGVLCLWGTAEIKLLQRPKGYDHEYIYVTVLCFGGNEEDFIGKIVEQRVRRSDEEIYEKLHCTIFVNFLDSKGKPFYDLLSKNPRKKYKLKITGRLKNGQNHEPKS